MKIAQEKIGLEPTNKLVIDINDADPSKGVNKAVGMLNDADLPVTDENIFIAATCLEKGIAYLKGEAKIGVRKNGFADGEAQPASASAPAQAAASPAPATPQAPPAPKSESAPSSGGGNTVTAHLPGTIVRVTATAGQQVKPDDIIMVIESMKMELDIPAGSAGTLASIEVAPGDAVQDGTVLAVIQ